MLKKIKVLAVFATGIQIISGLVTGILAILFILGKISSFFPCLISLFICVVLAIIILASNIKRVYDEESM